MVLRYSLFILLFSIGLVSCYEDSISRTTTTETVTPQISYRNDILGQVNDSLDAPLEGVVISLGGETTITDQDGRFILSNVRIEEAGSFLGAQLTSYIKSGIRLYPQASLRQEVTITLAQEEITGTLSNSVGGTVQSQQGMTLNIPAGAIIYDGTIYQGDYNVNVYYVDPRGVANYRQQLRAYDAFLSGTVLIPPKIDAIGMAYVSITDMDGNPLQITEGASINVSFPAQRSTAMSLSALTFDEGAGLWAEDGIATRAGETFDADFGDGGWWSVAEVVPAKSLCITFESNLEVPPSDNVVVVNTADGSNLYFGIVDYDYETCITVPESQDLVITVYKYCILPLTEVLVAAADIDGGAQLVSITENTGGYDIDLSFVGCDDALLSDDYQVTYAGRSMPLEINGSRVSITIDDCYDRGELAIVASAADAPERYTTTIYLDPTIESYVAQIKICGDGFPTSSSVIINDEVISNCKAVYNPEEIVVYSDDLTFLIGFDRREIGIQPCRVIYKGTATIGTIDVKQIGGIGEEILASFEAERDATEQQLSGVFRADVVR